MSMASENQTYVCETLPRFQADDPWRYLFHFSAKSPSSLFLLQLSAISFISQLMEVILKPLGQSTVVSHIFGGIILGPSFLGQKDEIAKALFPQRGNMILETFGTFGLMFFLFVVGVKIDGAVMLRPGRQAMVVGLFVFVFTLTLPIIFILILKQSCPVECNIANSLFFIALSQTLIGSPVIACLLTELKILNTDIGRLALSSSMFCDVLGVLTTVAVLSFTENKKASGNSPFYSLLSSCALIAAIIYIVKPAVMHIHRRFQDRKFINEIFVIWIFLLVLLSGFLSEIIGQHYFLGPLVLGLVVPDGPPLGSTIVSKLETLASRLFYPTFLAVSGLQTNIFIIKIQESWVVGIVLLFSCTVKIGAVMLPAKYINLRRGDSLVLGLILNARGFLQLILFNFWKHSAVISDEEFSFAVISMLVITGIVTPLIKHLYDPSKRYLSSSRCTIQHLKPEAELRILVCIHHQDNIPTIINLLEVSYASRDSPLAAIALILVELIGRSNPVLIAHQPDCTLERSSSKAVHIINALRQYEEHNAGCATVDAFTAISPYDLMHDDVCRLAFDKRATIAILPFHKQWAIDGSIGKVNRALQNMNIQILEMAPCSVAILVDRGVLTKHASFLTARSPYHIAVLFIGGPDDAESLALGTRMARHHTVDLTVIRFLLFGAENNKNRKLDSELIHEFRLANMEHEHFVVVEEMVRDGAGMAASIRGMEDCFDLIITGLRHEDNPILNGLHQWSECPELGVVGDILASPDFGSTSTVLLVQQQQFRGRFSGRRMMDSALVHDAPLGSWSIAMSR
ncbi:cation/H(+) antiporter 15-like [Cucurbita moschata]|uniref:Cation/H(+) antiporter 15-like n=1 Tax=Cucurbita moschata TaxID=3662 RepID=A0A6J1H163_CUCMO|nr:cation/H(+) antiporter 15-like [Cucurbita moschata]